MLANVHQNDWEFPNNFDYQTKIDLLVKFGNEILSTFEEVN